MRWGRQPWIGALALVLAADGSGQSDGVLAQQPSDARAGDGAFIRWREHVIDDEALGGVALRGSDGLQLADLDGDGFEDIVSVHESDDQYDGRPEGHVRIAFGTGDPDRWDRITLAEGAEAGGAEDVAVGDVNGDGYPDLVVACELAHLLYLRNPGPEQARQPQAWARHRPAATLDRGSFIRVFLADLDGDARPEVVFANKGVQDHTDGPPELREIGFFRLTGSPLEDAAWQEHVLTRIEWPINARPVDLDGDGDLDVVGGSVAEARMLWFENRPEGFREHAIALMAGRGLAPGSQPASAGFNMDFADLSGDGRLDIVTFDMPPLLGHRLIWLEQPGDPAQPWRVHLIGSYGPDSIVGVKLADIDGDGDPDVMTGGYSRGSRSADGSAAPGMPLGRLAWFENPGKPAGSWARHDISRRERGMFDQFVARDLDADGDIDFIGTRGNSGPYDGVFWLEQVRSPRAAPVFTPARDHDSPEVPLIMEH